MRLTLILAALCIASAAGWYIYALRGHVTDLKADLRDARAVIEAHEEAAAVLDAHIIYQRDQAAKWEQRAKDFAELEGADAPLGDYGRAVLDSLR